MEKTLSIGLTVEGGRYGQDHYSSIDLPAKDYEIEDCLQQARMQFDKNFALSDNYELEVESSPLTFLLPSIREFTKPLFSIPTHQFLFNAGQINPKEYMDALQIEPSEFELIRYPERGTCLYRCGNERYLLEVIAPEYKAELFGKGGGR